MSTSAPFHQWPSPPIVHDASNPTPVRDPGPMFNPTEVHDASAPPDPAPPKPVPQARSKR